MVNDIAFDYDYFYFKNIFLNEVTQPIIALKISNFYFQKRIMLLFLFFFDFFFNNPGSIAIRKSYQLSAM